MPLSKAKRLMEESNWNAFPVPVVSVSLSPSSYFVASIIAYAAYSTCIGQSQVAAVVVALARRGENESDGGRKAWAC